jgi:hypothetical protein
MLYYAYSAAFYAILLAHLAHHFTAILIATHAKALEHKTISNEAHLSYMGNGRTLGM